jgi:hypothetical protein
MNTNSAFPGAEHAVRPIAVNDNAPAANDNPTGPAHHRRRESMGEHLFNLTTYGGVTWIANEAISTVSWNWIAKEGTAGNRWFTAVKEKLPQWAHEPWRIVALCIGGTLLVPVVKFLEDRKGVLVRRGDLLFEGERAVNDPKLQEKYREMEEAPKQSWGSLAKGRAVVMGLAVALNELCGRDGTPSEKLLRGTPLNKYSTMDRMGASIARDTTRLPGLRWLEKDPIKREAIQEARKAAHFVPLDAAKEGRVVGALGGTFGFVLVLSAILTAIFYGSSKIFAARRDAKLQQRETASNVSRVSSAGVRFADEAPEKNTSPIADIPSNQVNRVVRDDTRLAQLDAAPTPA